MAAWLLGGGSVVERRHHVVEVCRAGVQGCKSIFDGLTCELSCKKWCHIGGDCYVT